MKRITLLLCLFCLLSITKTYAVVGIKSHQAPNACTKIVLTNGDTIEAKIIKIMPSTVTYKYCYMLGEPAMDISKKEVATIIYAQKSKEKTVINIAAIGSLLIGILNAIGVSFSFYQELAGVGIAKNSLLIGTLTFLIMGILGVFLGNKGIVYAEKNPKESDFFESIIAKAGWLINVYVVLFCSLILFFLLIPMK
jgi:hypothetical protein